MKLIFHKQYRRFNIKKDKYYFYIDENFNILENITNANKTYNGKYFLKRDDPDRELAKYYGQLIIEYFVILKEA